VFMCEHVSLCVRVCECMDTVACLMCVRLWCVVHLCEYVHVCFTFFSGHQHSHISLSFRVRSSTDSSTCKPLSLREESLFRLITKEIELTQTHIEDHEVSKFAAQRRCVRCVCL